MILWKEKHLDTRMERVQFDKAPACYIKRQDVYGGFPRRPIVVLPVRAMPPMELQVEVLPGNAKRNVLHDLVQREASRYKDGKSSTR